MFILRSSRNLSIRTFLSKSSKVFIPVRFSKRSDKNFLPNITKVAKISVPKITTQNQTPKGIKSALLNKDAILHEKKDFTNLLRIIPKTTKPEVCQRSLSPQQIFNKNFGERPIQEFKKQPELKVHMFYKNTKLLYGSTYNGYDYSPCHLVVQYVEEDNQSSSVGVSTFFTSHPKSVINCPDGTKEFRFNNYISGNPVTDKRECCPQYTSPSELLAVLKDNRYFIVSSGDTNFDFDQVDLLQAKLFCDRNDIHYEHPSEAKSIVDSFFNQEVKELQNFNAKAQQVFLAQKKWDLNQEASMKQAIKENVDWHSGEKIVSKLVPTAWTTKAVLGSVGLLAKKGSDINNSLDGGIKQD